MQKNILTFYFKILAVHMQSLPIFSVAELNHKVRSLLEHEMPSIGVRGEISNFIRASSKHCYFTLKDKHAQIRCACFTPYSLQKEMQNLSNGQEILAYGRVSLYEPRGDYQLIVTSIQDTGLGALYQQFIQLKTKLEQLGLFSSVHKKPLPKYPQEIAIITSPIGAAYHDIIKTLHRRYPLAIHTLYPSEVQGSNAHLQLINALSTVIKDQRAQVIIMARGGGSIEDLWAFNHEALAQAMFACPIPIITGIGHETDFTIADFVADQRASTPSIAAEKATPDQSELQNILAQYQHRLQGLMLTQLESKQKRLQWLSKIFDYPERWLFYPGQRLDFACKSLQEQMYYFNLRSQQAYQKLNHRLCLLNPEVKLQTQMENQGHFTQLLTKNFQAYLMKQYHQLDGLTKQLLTLSPQATLDRGYAIVSYQGQVLEQAQDLTIGASIDIKLAKGKLKAKIEGIQVE